MKKTILIIFYFFMSSIIYQRKVEAQTVKVNNNVQNIVGIAKDAKAGAILVSSDITYYIEGLDYWPSKIINHQISVTGTVVILQKSESIQKNTNNLEIQKNPDGKFIIKNATWKKKL